MNGPLLKNRNVLIALALAVLAVVGLFVAYAYRTPALIEPVKPIQAPPSVSNPAPIGGCAPTGCSKEICSDQQIITPCLYRPEYACYKNAKCERQSDGACGWTQTAALTACLRASKTTK